MNPVYGRRRKKCREPINSLNSNQLRSKIIFLRPFLLQPEESSPTDHCEECRFKAFLHWLCFSDPEALFTSFIQSIDLS